MKEKNTMTTVARSVCDLTIPLERPSLCMMTSNVSGVIVADNLGYAKVVGLAKNHGMAKQKGRYTRRGVFLRVRPYIRYAERTKMPRNAVDRTFCDAIKVVLNETIARRAAGCRVTVYVRQTVESEAAQGREYYGS